MHGRGGALAGVLLPLLLAACGPGGEEPAGPRDVPSAALGGPSAAPVTPPPGAMDDLERPVAERLSARLREQGLTLEQVECPHWHGRVPARLTCRAYVDGVAGDVAVHLARGRGGRVEFDARLVSGVVSTARLELLLDKAGWDDVDCGRPAAYPAVVGSEIVCLAHRGAAASYVVATVTNRRGEVSIADR